MTKAPSDRAADLRESEADVEQPQTGDRASRVAAVQPVAHHRHEVEQVVAIPEGSPGEDHEQQPDFEEIGRQQQPPHALAPSLRAAQPLDAPRHVAELAGVRSQFQIDRERACRLAR